MMQWLPSTRGGLRRRAALALLLACSAAGQAVAAERGPVCREASVVDEISREVRASDYYATVDPALVTEQPTADPLVVHCDVCVALAPYNTVRYGDRPVPRCVARGFSVQIVTRGFVVSPAR